MIYHIDKTTSTNDEARNPKYLHGDVVWAEEQTSGRGQRGHAWSSLRGENLTFSVILEPSFLPTNEQFLLSEAVALALTDSFAVHSIDTRIKWTNDIYAGDRKLVGILIENDLAGGNLARSIVGIGININQSAFDPELPNPVSMAQLRGRYFDRATLLEQFLEILGKRYAQLEKGDKEGLQRDYEARLYRKGEVHPFRFADGVVLPATIEGVRPWGALVLRRQDGTVREYLFKEVEFVL